MSTTRTISTAQHAREHHITPRQCRRCGLTTYAGLSWDGPGHDNGLDPNWTGFQCRNCGRVTGLTRSQILRRVRAEREDQ